MGMYDRVNRGGVVSGLCSAPPPGSDARRDVDHRSTDSYKCARYSSASFSSCACEVADDDAPARKPEDARYPTRARETRLSVALCHGNGTPWAVDDIASILRLRARAPRCVVIDTGRESFGEISTSEFPIRTPTPQHATSSASFRARTRGDADDDARSDARVRSFASRRAVSPRSRPAEDGTPLVSPAESAFASSTSTRRLRARVRQDVVQPRGPGAHAPGGRRGLGGGTPVHVEFNRRRRQDGRSEARGRRAVGPLARGP